MSRTTPSFDWRRLMDKCRCVDLRTTMDIAHRCTSGVTFQGSSKSAIIEGVARPHGYSAKPEKFVVMMNQAALQLPAIKQECDRKVYQKLNELDSQWEAENKP